MGDDPDQHSSEHPSEHKGRRVLALRTAEQWREWLRTEGARPDATSVWLTVWKQGAGEGLLMRDEVVDEALCHGWIDSTANAYDERSYLLLVAPRKKGSVWSAVNKAHLVRLEAQGRVTPAGRAVIDRAIEDGSWTILDSVEALEVPADLAEALGRADLESQWSSLAPSRRKYALTQLVLAKSQATRNRRIDVVLDELRAG